MELKGKKVLVVGLGKSGASAARLCLAKGALVTATDTAPQPLESAGLSASGVRLVLGGHRLEDFLAADLVVLSPGVDPSRGEAAAARQHGVPVIGELELGYVFLKAPSVMVTGTNGKSTVTRLIGEMLIKAGQRVFVGGNLGTPLCDFVAQAQEVDWAVLEVSSFQIDTSLSLRPEVAVLLNISPDHLDRYPDFPTYAASKFSLFPRQAKDHVAVLYADDPEISSRLSSATGRAWLYGGQGPHRPGGWLEKTDLVLAAGRDLIRLSTQKSKLPGKYNRLNMLAAALAALACGAPASAMQSAIDEFKGLPHRLQFVASLAGVDYYDDSKGTNLGAVQAVLESLEQPLVLLLGGHYKGGDFSQLASFIKNGVRGIVCFGEAGPVIHGQVASFTNSQVVPDLPAALSAAAALAKPGDMVLLSPGCASFDAYRNYAHRGEHFQTLVKEKSRG